METQLEGIICAPRYDPDRPQFLGAVIECSDGKVWVIDYGEQSPYHRFDGRRVVVVGEPYQPEGSYMIRWHDRREVGHFRVATIRPAEVTADLELVEVGPACELSGRLMRDGTSDTGRPVLSFVTQDEDVFQVVNDPAGAEVGRDVEVLAYPVQLSRSTRRCPGRYLWIICPYSVADRDRWRSRQDELRP